MFRPVFWGQVETVYLTDDYDKSDNQKWIYIIGGFDRKVILYKNSFFSKYFDLSDCDNILGCKISFDLEEFDNASVWVLGEGVFKLNWKKIAKYNYVTYEEGNLVVEAHELPPVYE